MNRQKWIDRKFEPGIDNSRLSEVLEKLLRNPARIEKLFDGIPDELLNKKPGGKWSVKENIGHLSDLEELHSARIDDFIEGKEILRVADMQNKKTEGANHNNKSASQLIDQFRNGRINFIGRIKPLDQEILNRESIHPRLKQPMRIVDMAYFVAEHDDHHIGTIKELIDQIK